jgi:tetratricopeptide (TPR) repeat protein
VALLRALVRDPPAPLLFVCNHRPGFALGEGARSFELRELSSRQARELLGSLLEGAQPPEELVRFVDARSDGNPFYVEEVVHSLLETHVLRRSEAGWSLDRPLTEAEVPTTIRGVIAARIDRLDEHKRRLLREASVVGREFLHGVIARVTFEPTELAPSLRGLETVNLIRTKTPEPDLEYIFKHALTQEVAYDGLLKSERQQLHERVAFAFEGLVGDRAPEFVETIAYHFLRSGLVDKAVHYAVKAGNKCAVRFALDEANVHFRNAFTLLTGRARTPGEDRALIALLVDWGFVLYFCGRFGELRGLLEAHEEVAERVEDLELRGMFLAWLGYLLYFAEELPASIEKLELACRLGETSGKTRTIAYAHTWKAFALSGMGRLSEAIQAAEAGHALAQDLPEDGYVSGWSLDALGIACVAGGDLERARRIAREMIALAGESGDAHYAVAGQCLLAQVHLAALEFDSAIEAAEAARGQTRDPMGRWWPLAYQALGLALALRFEECRPVAVELRAWAEEHCAENLATPAKAAGAMVSLGEGRLSKGMAALLALHADARRRSLVFNEAWLTVSIGIVYARIATRNVPINIPSLLRNPGFVLRHALPARRKARAWLERGLEASRDSEIKQQDGAIHLELATLLARRDPATARTHLERAVAIFELQGAHGALHRARELAVSLGAGGATG